MREYELYEKYKDNKDVNEYAALKIKALRKKSFILGVIYGGIISGIVVLHLLLLLL